MIVRDLLSIRSTQIYIYIILDDLVNQGSCDEEVRVVV